MLSFYYMDFLTLFHILNSLLTRCLFCFAKQHTMSQTVVLRCRAHLLLKSAETFVTCQTCEAQTDPLPTELFSHSQVAAS